MSLIFLAVAPWLVSAPLAARGPTPHPGDFVVPADPRELERFCRKHDVVEGVVTVGPEFLAADLSDLACIREVHGGLVIRGTPSLESLDGLRFRTGEGMPLRRVKIVDNAALRDVSALSELPDLAVARLELRGNPVLREVERLPPVVSGAVITVEGNLELRTLRGPDGHRRSSKLGEVYVSNNPRLEELSGFERVVEAESVVIQANARLRTLGGWPRLADVGRLEVVGHPILSSWTAAPLLSSVGLFRVEDAGGLTELPGFVDLQRIGQLIVRDNTVLDDVSGLTVCRDGHPTVDAIEITHNPKLENHAIALLRERVHLPNAAQAWVVHHNAGSKDASATDASPAALPLPPDPGTHNLATPDLASPDPGAEPAQTEPPSPPSTPSDSAPQ